MSARRVNRWYRRVTTPGGKVSYRTLTHAQIKSLLARGYKVELP